MSYHHLTPEERGQIQALRTEGKSHRAIARRLGRSPATVSRELARNGDPHGYSARHAQQRYRERRRPCRPRAKLEHPGLRAFVFDKLPSGWTPEQVAGRLRLEHPDDPRMRISHEALYQALYGDERLHCLLAHLPQARPKRRRRGQGKTRRGPSIPNRVGIEDRPAVVDTRERFGDWEGDTVVGAHQHGFVATLVERKSRLLRACKTVTKEAVEVARAVTETLLDLPASWLKTLTFDNGTEFARHADIAAILPLLIFFARPYASYQRATNENTNGLLRRYFPKGTDLRDVSQEQLDRAVEEINNRPRKVLGYRTPNEVFQQELQRARVALSP